MRSSARRRSHENLFYVHFRIKNRCKINLPHWLASEVLRQRAPSQRASDVESVLFSPCPAISYRRLRITNQQLCRRDRRHVVTAVMPVNRPVEERRTMPVPCPMCGSSHQRKTDSQAAFQVLASRRCDDCGHIWEPDAPRWLLKAGLFIGLSWVALGGFLTFGGPLVGRGQFEFRFFWLCATGITALVGCWCRLKETKATAGTCDPCLSEPSGAD